MISVEDKETLNRMNRGRFIKNNGLVLRTMTVLERNFKKLSEIIYALEINVQEDESIKSLNYLYESGYIRLRQIKTKKEADISDFDIEELEAKITQKGTLLMEGVIVDELVEV